MLNRDSIFEPRYDTHGGRVDCGVAFAVVVETIEDGVLTVADRVCLLLNARRREERRAALALLEAWGTWRLEHRPAA